MAGFVEVERPFVSPGTCFNCRSGEKEGLRWFDANVEPWKMGRLYLCSLCVENLAYLLQIHPNNALVERIAELEVENERGKYAMAVLGGLRVVFESLDSDAPDTEQIIATGIAGAKKLTSKS